MNYYKITSNASKYAGVVCESVETEIRCGQLNRVKLRVSIEPRNNRHLDMWFYASEVELHEQNDLFANLVPGDLITLDDSSGVRYRVIYVRFNYIRVEHLSGLRKGMAFIVRNPLLVKKVVESQKYELHYHNKLVETFDRKEDLTAHIETEYTSEQVKDLSIVVVVQTRMPPMPVKIKFTVEI